MRLWAVCPQDEYEFCMTNNAPDAIFSSAERAEEYLQELDEPSKYDVIVYTLNEKH